MKHSFDNIIKFFALSAVICGVSGCSESDLDNLLGLSSDDVINIGGIETKEMTVVTRAAVDAETVDWLVQPLTNGLDITYGLSGVSHSESNEAVAILKLTNKETNPATYSFNYRPDGVNHTNENEKAVWYNNGFHYFQGVHVPERIRYNTDPSEVEAEGKAPNLTLDQHNDNATGTDAQLGNYTLLSHYLGMPANYKVTATVERIKLPFRHRLARVVAFVLIDPELKTYLKGYKTKQADGTLSGNEDPTTTSLRFCNVKVLQGVKDVVDATNHHTLTPLWKTARKVVPHFDGERGSYSYKTQQVLDENFKMYIETTSNSTEEYYPTTDGWQAIHDASDHKRMKEVNYGKVPVYDIIVQPTYTSWEYVMYDEAGYDADNENALKAIANAKNSIDFEIELDNGLRYEKTFEFDLNANYQTVVYLRINREKVNYDDAGSELWIEEKKTDGWYGVDNENGNTLSKAGSSWQRAYRTTTISETAGTTSGVTDGDFYNNKTESVGQYLGDADKWIKLLLQACEGGEHHGDYFILDQNININAQDIPAGFVFTGHLDAQDHTITLTGTGADTYEVTTNYALYPETDLYETNGSSYSKFVLPDLYICEEVAQAKPMKNIFAGWGINSQSGTIPAGDGKMKKVENPVLQTVMTDGVTYYVENNGTYSVWTRPVLYTHRISASALFCGLDGTYTTNQESANPQKDSDNKVIWEANVHKETNKSTVWVPTPGYRAEVLNAIVKGGKLFPENAIVTGNVQNCFNVDAAENKTAVTNTPNIPQYK